MTVRSLLHRILRPIFWRQPSWKQIEYFNVAWKERIRAMALHISPNSTVVDMGCGEMWLQEFLPSGCHYYGVDYRKRAESVVQCDFNKNEYPAISADVYFVSGAMEYVADYQRFAEHVAECAQRCVLSYCCLEEFSDLQDRRQHAWVNNLSRSGVVKLFEVLGMRLTFSSKTPSGNTIFVFDRNMA